MTELDEITLRRAQKGDRQAQEIFLRRYVAPLHALIRRSGVPGDVEDLTHDLLSRLIVALPRFQPGGSATLTTWVFTIAQRFIIDLSRKKHLHLEPLEAGESVADATPGAIENLERKELQRRLELAIETLPLDQRRTFVLAQVHERPLQEIADAESVALGTVKSRLHRAREALMAVLSGGARADAR